MNKTFKKLTAEIKKELVEYLQSKDVLEFVAQTKAAEDAGSFEVVISTADIDRQGETIDQDGWDLSFYRMNPVVLWAHDYSSLPIGITTEIDVKDGKLIAKGMFAPEDANPFAQQVRRLYDLKIVRATSVGFIPLETDGKTIKKAELLEFSFVPVPANPFALSLSKAKELGLDLTMLATKGLKLETKQDEPKEGDPCTLEDGTEGVLKPNEEGNLVCTPKTEEVKAKGAIPYENHGTAPEDTEWDAAKVQEEVWGDGTNQKKYAAIHAWMDSSVADDDGDGYPDTKGAYKLPHHNADLKAVWKGVASAMAALLGTRGGVDIPEDDRKAVYDHLAKHYEEFGKEPPEFKVVTKPEVTENFIRIPIKDPENYDPDSIRTITISEDEGIQALTACPKGEYEGGKCNVGVEIITYLFDKEKWTEAEAQAWVDQHKGAKPKSIEKIGAELAGLQNEVDDAIVKHSQAIIEIVRSEYGEEEAEKIIKAIKTFRKSAASTNKGQGGLGEERTDGCAPKQRSNSAGFDTKAFEEWLAVRQVLRLINNITSNSLAKFNERARERHERRVHETTRR